MYAMIVIAVVNLAGHMMTVEYRMHPIPDLETCQGMLKDRLEAMAAERQFQRRVIKSDCEKL